MHKSSRVALVGSIVCACFFGSAQAGSIQGDEAKQEAQLPVCDRPLGTIAVHLPDVDWWTPLQLGSPDAILQGMVLKSGCFRLVDRGSGLRMAEDERSLASSGDSRHGSNYGRGQVRAADYFLVPTLTSKNGHAGGLNVGGLLGFIPGPVGVIASNINLNSKTADVQLTLVDGRSTDILYAAEGHAKKTDLGIGGGGATISGGGFGGMEAMSYQNSGMGNLIELAYLQAYADLVAHVQQSKDLPSDASVAAPPQTLTVSRPAHLYSSPSDRSMVKRALSPGMFLYPTGETQGVWRHVTDEAGNDGWVSSAVIENAK